MLTLDQGILMALVVNGIGIPLLFFAYYIGFKKHEEKIRKEEEDKKPKPWQW